ncbi:right-handed parallel beta-helix repeat-containing protein [Ramlibacter sp. MMS24-I3-19]|uniref:right-handed parallel beta-helix repeat-containing protein n=1 Tax=Ramlibacter sp. MMS24-I3-19 TaxID=3416606 RepID=UPI003CFD1065
MLSILAAAVLFACSAGSNRAAAVAGTSAPTNAIASEVATPKPPISLKSSAPALSLIVAAASVRAPGPAPSHAGISLTNYGGVCDGRTDNNAAIARGIADTHAKGVALLIPAGQCNFSQVIHLDAGKITGSGPTSVLYATNYLQSAIIMSGDGPSVTNLKLTGKTPPSRQNPWESTKITALGATNFVIDSVTIDNAAAAAIATGPNSSKGRITNNKISNSLADSIHMTDGSSYITVEGNTIENSGDDGIAVVSYAENPSPVNNITARNNVIRNNKDGRGMSVVGGRTVLYENNYIEGNPQWACMYIAQESSYDTKNVVGVTVQRNTFKDCGSLNSHAAVMIFSNGQATNDNIKLISNDIVQDSRNGIRYFGPQTRVLLQNNRYSGSGTPYVGDPSSNVTIIKYTIGPVGYVAP